MEVRRSVWRGSSACYSSTCQRRYHICSLVVMNVIAQYSWVHETCIDGVGPLPERRNFVLYGGNAWLGPYWGFRELKVVTTSQASWCTLRASSTASKRRNWSLVIGKVDAGPYPVTAINANVTWTVSREPNTKRHYDNNIADVCTHYVFEQT